MVDSYKGIPGNHLGKTFDAALMFADVGTTATEATVLGDVLAVGSGLIDGDVVLDIKTSTGANAVAIELGDGTTFAETVSVSVSAAGRYIIPFRNQIGDDIKTHVRLKTTVGTALVLGAFIARR